MAPKILIVEDNESIRLVVRMTLEMGNYEVIEAEDGRQGVECLKNHSDCALVITDLAMPVMDGFQLLDHIRNNMKRRDLPIFVLSAEKDASAALDSGAMRLIRKPFSPVELLEAVKQAIQPTKL
jgi:CheY-like chemotaxis protein